MLHNSFSLIKICHFYFLQKAQIAVNITSLFILCSTCGALFIILLITSLERIFGKVLRVISVVLWIVLLSSTYLHTGFSQKRSADNDAPFVYYIIVIIYAILPINKKFAVILGSLTGVSQLILGGVLANTNKNDLPRQVGFVFRNISNT